MGRLISWDISEYRIDELADDDLQPILDLVNLVGAEREPRYVPMTAAEFRVFADSPGFVRTRWVGRDSSGSPIGLANTGFSDDGSSPEMLRTQIAVAPGQRRQGLGTGLLRKAVEQADALGRTLLSGSVFDTAPEGSQFAKALGARETMEFHVNSVRISDLDLSLLREWAAAGPRRAPGYAVRTVEGPWPEDLLPGMAHLYHVLERDMPTPESWEPREWTAELVGEMQAHYLQGTDSLSAFAMREEGDVLAGMNQLVRRHHDPGTWMVTTTMVDPAHRGRALGKWLKAVVALEALAKWPGGEWMETGNAQTNEAMLGINHEMGFAHEHTWTDVEADVEVARAYLDGRSAGNIE